MAVRCTKAPAFVPLFYRLLAAYYEYTAQLDLVFSLLSYFYKMKFFFKRSYQNNLNIPSIWPGRLQTSRPIGTGQALKGGFWTLSNFIGTSKYS